MRALCVTISETRATVILTPSWIGRLFGVKSARCELYRSPHVPGAMWESLHTGRVLIELPYGALIRKALEIQPMGDLPPAVLRRVLCAGDQESS
jgi:hypothetical protein